MDTGATGRAAAIWAAAAMATAWMAWAVGMTIPHKALTTVEVEAVEETGDSPAHATSQHDCAVLVILTARLKCTDWSEGDEFLQARVVYRACGAGPEHAFRH